MSKSTKILELCGRQCDYCCQGTIFKLKIIINTYTKVYIDRPFNKLYLVYITQQLYTFINILHLYHLSYLFKII